MLRVSIEYDLVDGGSERGSEINEQCPIVGLTEGELAHFDEKDLSIDPMPVDLDFLNRFVLVCRLENHFFMSLVGSRLLVLGRLAMPGIHRDRLSVAIDVAALGKAEIDSPVMRKLASGSLGDEIFA